MPTLTPVEGDPFAAASPAPSGGPKLTPVEGDPFAAPAEPQTTAGGLAAAAGRGLAPIATGAAIGAGIGSIVPGPGTALGAAAGGGAVLLTDLASAVYRPLAEQFGWPKVASPQEMTDRVLDMAGVKRPSTGIERGVEAATGGAAGASAGAKLAGEIAGRAATPLVRAIAGRAAEKPGVQMASGALGGAAGQAAAEAGGGPLAQYAASTLAGSLPYAPTGARAAIATDARPAALEARKSGYVLPPAAISEKPGLISSMLAGWGGKIKTQQAASDHNQTVTNGLAAQALGLPGDTVLTDQVFQNLRQRAGSAYQAVANAMPNIAADPTYQAEIAALSGANSQAHQLFPKITKNPGIKELIDDLQANPQMPTPAAVEIVKELRFNANANMKARDDPSRLALGMTQRQAADAIDALMERNITASGQPDVVSAYRQARQLIAKSYDVEGATNSATGDVNARYIAGLAAKGRPLTGELDKIANTAMAFPKAMMPPAGFGYNDQWSALDFFGAAATAAHGHPAVAATILGRPAARAAVLSEPYQKAMTNQRPTALPLPLLLDPGFGSVTQPESAKTFGVQ